jgi:hypothetical protein
MTTKEFFRVLLERQVARKRDIREPGDQLAGDQGIWVSEYQGIRAPGIQDNGKGKGGWYGKRKGEKDESRE